MTKSKKDILWRIYLVYFLTCLFCLAIISKIVMIQFVEGEELRAKGKILSRRIVDIQAVRGNIYDCNGNLLATSLPIYEVRMDLNSDALTDEVFNENIDSLCIRLADFFKSKTALEYKVELVTARRKGARYHLIKRNVRHNELKTLKTFPLFRKGKFKGGFIYIQRNKREKPFRMLAHRTLGYSRENAGNVGVEGAFDEELKGVSGSRLMQKISGGIWKPINDENEIQPQDGYDVFTTIDINIQDLAYEALLRQLEKQEADHGCVVVMEVKTGEIKAIANLSKGTMGKYYEKYNYAIGERDEPGSTFKLASVIALLEDGYVDPDDSVDTEDGSTQFYDYIVHDSKPGGHGTISFQQSFEKSSNVGISKLVEDSYGKNPEKFIAQLRKMHLDRKTGIEILGEEEPVIIDVNSDDWSGTTLPSMAIGYSTRFSPLQILTLYNAVANQGKMVKPRL
ncbi:MAG: hypothetical protein IH948_02480, partial [Bacteroidetes bacterium]|nr:hypothetical protein [Bacteroidota bacterium]